ncbi:MAG: hypothetical protein R3288_05960 [Woeseiaceae bacterium]|nr:hypothetical protein [Woeseiaceae bacterium]
MSKPTMYAAKLALVAILGGLAGIAWSDTLQMDNPRIAADDGRPTRGMTQGSVESRYGSPTSKRAPVGDPPITRWEYPNMIVYFEYDRVIHAVKKR